MSRFSDHRGRGFALHPALWIIIALCLPPLLGCGAVGSASSAPQPGISVTIAPQAASILLGAPQVFTATVANSSNTAVVWSVNGIAGGNAALGTISASGVYTAPRDLPSGSIIVAATSVADSSAVGASPVTVVSDINVVVSPSTMPVALGASQAFAATVNSAGNPDRGVNWIVSGAGCTGATCGTINSSGSYVAPQILIAPANVTVTAVSVADPSKTGTASAAITSSFTLSLNGVASLDAGATSIFVATLTAAPNSDPDQAISWSVSGAGCSSAACGSITQGGAYTAPSIPPSPATVQITATPAADPSKSASVNVSILSSTAVTVSPTAATVALGASQAFQATVTGAQDTSVTWDVDGTVGGSSALGTIQNSQTAPDNTIYTAPQSLPSGGSVTIRARSNANPNVFATATVTLSTGMAVVLTPSVSTLAIEERQSFLVQVNNAANQTVNLQVNGIAGGSTAAGQICVAASNPCQSISATAAGAFDYLAPSGVPSPNPVTLVATSQVAPGQNASASITILPHVVISVLPSAVTLSSGGQQQFAVSVEGTENQQVIWALSGAGCGVAGACGSISSTGLYSAPPGAPSPDLITITATSTENSSQSASATVTIAGVPQISSLSPSSIYAGAAGGFTLEVAGSGFVPTSPGPGSSILISGTARTTSCASVSLCTTSFSASDLALAGSLPVEVENPGDAVSNTVNFVVQAEPSGSGSIPLTPGAPSAEGENIVVVELSTNGGSGATADVSLNIAALGAYSVSTSSCFLAGSTVTIVRPASGTSTADVCAFSVSGLDPSFSYTVSGPATPGVTVIAREPLGLGIVHLTLQVPASAAAGPRTLFIQNPNKDQAAGSGSIEVQ